MVLRQERRAAEKLFVDWARRFPSVISEWAKSHRQLRRQKFIAGREFGACRHNLAARRKSIAPSPDIFPRPQTDYWLVTSALIMEGLRLRGGLFGGEFLRPAATVDVELDFITADLPFVIHFDCRAQNRRLIVSQRGSERESVETAILRGFSDGDEFGTWSGHSLSFQEQISYVFIAAASA